MFPIYYCIAVCQFLSFPRLQNCTRKAHLHAPATTQSFNWLAQPETSWDSDSENNFKCFQSFINVIMSFFLSTLFSFALRFALNSVVPYDMIDTTSHVLIYRNWNRIQSKPLAPGSFIESHGLQLGNHLYANGNEVYSIASIVANCRNPESIYFL